jgi:3',5'-nucleoside bisphosphate phosphatase
LTTVDLHLHSHFSNDADFSPTELVHRCLAAGLTHAAIADHNAVSGVAEAQKAAAGTGLGIISAVELDCQYDGLVLHVLGYGIDHTASIFSEIEDDLHQQEKDNSAHLIERVLQLGFDFDDAVIAELAFDGVVTGEMIAEAALLFDSEAKNPLLDPYRDDGARSDNPFVNFYWDYCSQGKPAYIPMNFPSLSQAVDVIRSNHGVPVLAHPGLQVKRDAALLEGIIAEGIAGLEVYSSYHTLPDAHYFQQAARAHALLMTCGSDFHGKTKKSIKIGGINCQGQDWSIISALIEKINCA